MNTIKVLSPLAVMGAMRDLTRQFEVATGTRVEAEFAPTVALLERLRAGANADVGLLTAQGIDDLIAEGVMRAGSRTDVAISFVGIAVKAGAAHPPIAS